MLGDLGKLIVAKGFKKLPKVQKSPDLVTLLEIFLARHLNIKWKEDETPKMTPF